MKALTIYSPFAQLIVSGLKRYETRSRKCNIRGRIAIHSALKPPTKVIKGLQSEKQKAFIYETTSGNLIDKSILKCGYIIGTVYITECVPVEEIKNSLSAEELMMGDYSNGRYAIKLENPVILNKPIAAKGSQGWWNTEEL